MKAAATRLTRTFDLTHAIRSRACQAGPRGGRLLETGLTRITAAGQQPEPTLLFIQHIIDPLSVIRSRPDANFSRLELSADETVFWLTTQWHITTTLQNLLYKEWELKMPLSSSTRASSIQISFRQTPPQIKSGQAALLKELRENLSTLKYQGKQRPILVPDKLSLSKDMLMAMSIMEKVWSDSNKVTVRRVAYVSEQVK